MAIYENIPLEWRTKLGRAVGNWLAGRWGANQRIALIIRKTDGTTYQVLGAAFSSADAERDYIRSVLMPDPEIEHIRQKGILDDLLPALPDLMSALKKFGADPASRPSDDVVSALEQQFEQAQTTLTQMQKGLIVGGVVLGGLLSLLLVLTLTGR